VPGVNCRRALDVRRTWLRRAPSFLRRFPTTNRCTVSPRRVDDDAPTGGVEDDGSGGAEPALSTEKTETDERPEAVGDERSAGAIHCPLLPGSSELCIWAVRAVLHVRRGFRRTMIRAARHGSSCRDKTEQRRV
jgi:hypothetical protein